MTTPPSETPTPRTYRAWLVAFACNDPDNGNFTGRVGMIEIESLYPVGRSAWDAELYHADVTFHVDYSRLEFRIHRHKFPFKSSQEWFGNWCWNAFVVTREQGKRLLRILKRNGWHCECGSTAMFDWINKERAT